MDRIALSLFLSLVLSTGSLAQEDRTPHLELVKGLRERGYHDLALSYLESLQAAPNALNSELKAVLPMELARSRTEYAATMPAGSERDILLQRARNDLEVFLRVHPQEPLASETKLALANCIAEQARNLAVTCERAGISSPNPSSAAKDLHGQAIGRFNEADQLYGSLQKRLEDQLGLRIIPEKSPNKADLLNNPPRSNPLYLSTLFYRAQARYDLSRMAGLGVRLSGLANDEARQHAEKLSQYRAVSPLAWHGYALFARTLEGADDAKANQIYRTIDQANTPNAQAAQRAMRYYPLARADASGELSDKGPGRDRLHEQAERWLQLYGPVAGNSKDAQHVRYILLRIIARELEETPENRRQTTESQTKLERALSLIDSMDNGKADNQDALERLKYSLLRLSGRARGPLETLRTFDEALLRASLEFHNQQTLEAKLIEVGNTAARADVEAQFRKQVETTLAVLRKAQSLMPDARVSERNRIQLLNMMQNCLRRQGDGYRAAILCEHLALTARQPEVAQYAATEALRLYQYLSHEGGKVDSVATSQLMKMARLLDQSYPESVQADEARSILGRDLIARREYDAAISMLIKVKANPGTARYLAGLAAWSKHRDLNKDLITIKSDDSVRALALLQESITAFAQQQNKNALEQRAEVQASLLTIGIHDTLNDLDAIITSSQPLLIRIEKNQMPAGLAPGTELQVIETVMSAYIRKRDLQEGPARLLAILNQRKDDPQLSDVTTILQSTAYRMRQLLDELAKKGNAGRIQYQATLSSYRLFLAQIEKDPKLPLRLRVWLGTSYSGIGDFAKAAEILKAVPVPTTKSTEPPDEEHQLFRQSISARITAMLRLAEGEQDVAARDKALTVLEKELQTLMSEPWARRNPTLLRDDIYLQQLRGNYSGKTGAIVRWDEFRAMLRPHIEKSEGMKELFWETQYNLTWCLYQEAALMKTPEAQKIAIDRAAGLFHEAESARFGTSAQAKRFNELLANPRHADLKAAVDRLASPSKSSNKTP